MQRKMFTASLPRYHEATGKRIKRNCDCDCLTSESSKYKLSAIREIAGLYANFPAENSTQALRGSILQEAFTVPERWPCTSSQTAEPVPLLEGILRPAAARFPSAAGWSTFSENNGVINSFPLRGESRNPESIPDRKQRPRYKEEEASRRNKPSFSLDRFSVDQSVVRATTAAREFRELFPRGTITLLCGRSLPPEVDTQCKQETGLRTSLFSRGHQKCLPGVLPVLSGPAMNHGINAFIINSV